MRTGYKKSALVAFAYMVEKDGLDLIRKRYGVSKQAAKVIRELRNENSKLKIQIEVLKKANLKKGRGRPKKIKNSSHRSAVSALFPQEFVSEPNLKTSKKGGRPIKHTAEEMREFIKKCDGLKNQIKEKTGKTIADKELLERLVKVLESTRSLSGRQKRIWLNKSLKQLKYFRDQTGLRQRPKKRKTQ